MENDRLTFDFFPGMVFQKAPRFTCNGYTNEPALDWTGLTTPALKAAAARFPETKAICRKYDLTLRVSYFGLFGGPLCAVVGGRVLALSEAAPELRVIMFVLGLALLGGSLLLNKDTGAHLKNLVAVYNTLAAQESPPKIEIKKRAE